MKMALCLSAVAAIVVLAGCSSTPASLTARHLATRIPGCTQITEETPAVMEIQDVTCTLPDGAIVEIATFATSNDERRWILDGGSPQSPDPAYAGCCIQGNKWAAAVGFSIVGKPGIIDDQLVTKAIGGRIVSG
jgi:hypothetical protein